MFKEKAPLFFKSLQDQVTKTLNEVNRVSFREDLWERPGGGGGRTRIYSDGYFLEKGGVNFSEVYGELNPQFAATMPMGEGTQFYATGISLVLHPTNPFIPSVHANFRYIQRGTAGWFGGGADLTPYYPFDEDCKHFHKTYYNALKPYGKYAEFKEKCDEYFYLPHRGETRGIGGIFFDYQQATSENFEMVQACGNAFLESYMPIVLKRMDTAFTEEQKTFQEIRRGRYVEYNLIYDRGTLFGLKTNGRVESILMSLPKKVRWEYDHTPAVGSEEARLLSYLKPRNWVDTP